MSNFSALTRRKGSSDEFKDAVWIDDYFGLHHYGVRFRGSTTILDAADYEMADPAKISLCQHCNCMTHTLIGGLCGKCKNRKIISVIIPDENIGGESRRLNG